jgi:hypothetical protein
MRVAASFWKIPAPFSFESRIARIAVFCWKYRRFLCGLNAKIMQKSEFIVATSLLKIGYQQGRS